MTITVNALGPNSARIVYSAGETAENMRAAVGTWLTQHGWQVHDAEYFVYKAPCRNRPETFKYIQVYITSTPRLYFRVYENWDAVSHVGVNESAYRYSAPSGTTYSNVAGVSLAIGTVSLAEEGNIYIYATARYALMNMINRLNGTVGMLAGVVEWTEEGIDSDPDGVPFGWTTVNNIVGGYTAGKTSVPYYHPSEIFPPKSFGEVGVNAMMKVMTRFGLYTDDGIGGTGTSFTQAGSNIAASGVFPAYRKLPTVNQPMTNLPRAYTISVDAVSALSGAHYNIAGEFQIGKVYGIKVIAGNIANWVDNDRVNANVGSENFLDPNGSPYSHHVIKTHVASNVALIIPE